MISKNVSVHNLSKGGVNMNAVIYNEMLLKLLKFGIVDIADFSVHYLQYFLGRENSANLHDIQRLVDEEAVRLNNLDTWE